MSKRQNRQTPTRAGETVADLTPAPYNPRKITDEKLVALNASMDAFGDLSGIVRNIRTGRLVGGHQRTKNLPADAPIVVTDRMERTDRGTVALGYIQVAGERWLYREVDWDEETELAANIAANKHGGDWDIPKLSDMLSELDANGFNMTLTGFDEKELADLLGWSPDGDSVQTEQHLPETEYLCLVACKTEKELEALYEELTGRGLECKLIA